jgi:hypothetical protein
VRFCGSSPKFIALAIKNQTIDFQPSSGHLTVWLTDGDLVIDANGILECTTCSIASEGVTIIFTRGTGANAIVGGVSMQSNGAISTLNAPNTGAFSGVLIAQDPAGPFTNPSSTGTSCKNVSSPCSTFHGNPGTTLTGLVYFPNTSVDFQGNPAVGSNACLLLVVKQVEVIGSSTFQDAGCTNAGLNNVPTVKTISLAE